VLALRVWLPVGLFAGGRASLNGLLHAKTSCALSPSVLCFKALCGLSLSVRTPCLLLMALNGTETTFGKAPSFCFKPFSRLFACLALARPAKGPKNRNVRMSVCRTPYQPKPRLVAKPKYGKFPPGLEGSAEKSTWKDLTLLPGQRWKPRV
jgi:hypothetical protein